MHVIANTILPGDLVFDIGANVGDKAEWFAGKLARVIAVEPQPAMVDIMRHKFAANPLVTVVPKGLGAEPGTLTMSINTATPVLSTFTDDWKVGRFAGSRWDQEIPIEITTLDALVEEFGVPRYTKIDVEGFERQVIAGLSKNIGCLSFEFASEYYSYAEEICKSLQKLGYSKFNVSLGENTTFSFDDWTTAETVMSQLYAITTSGHPLLWGDIYAL